MATTELISWVGQQQIGDSELASDNHGFARYTDVESMFRATKELNRWQLRGIPLVVDVSRDTLQKLKAEKAAGKQKPAANDEVKRPLPSKPDSSLNYSDRLQDTMYMTRVKEHYSSLCILEDEGKGKLTTKLLLDDIDQSEHSRCLSHYGKLQDQTRSFQHISEKIMRRCKMNASEGEMFGQRKTEEFKFALRIIMSEIDEFLSADMSLKDSVGPVTHGDAKHEPDGVSEDEVSFNAPDKTESKENLSDKQIELIIQQLRITMEKEHEQEVKHGEEGKETVKQHKAVLEVEETNDPIKNTAATVDEIKSNDYFYQEENHEMFKQQYGTSFMEMDEKTELMDNGDKIVTIANTDMQEVKTDKPLSCKSNHASEIISNIDLDQVLDSDDSENKFLTYHSFISPIASPVKIEDTIADFDPAILDFHASAKLNEPPESASAQNSLDALFMNLGPIPRSGSHDSSLSDESVKGNIEDSGVESDFFGASTKIKTVGKFRNQFVDEVYGNSPHGTWNDNRMHSAINVQEIESSHSVDGMLRCDPAADLAITVPNNHHMVSSVGGMEFPAYDKPVQAFGRGRGLTLEIAASRSVKQRGPSTTVRRGRGILFTMGK